MIRGRAIMLLIRRTVHTLVIATVSLNLNIEANVFNKEFNGAEEC